MKNLIFMSILLFLGVSSIAQQKQIKLNSVYTDRSVYPIRMVNLQWMTDENAYTFIEDTILMKGSINSKMANKPLFDLAKFNTNISKAGLKELKRFPNFAWRSSNTLSFAKYDTLYEYNTTNGKTTALCYYPKDVEYLKLNPANLKQTAYTKENNLFVADGKNVITITNDENKGIVNGQTVSRSEFGIEDGIFWSPKGNFLAFYRKDETKVGEYPIVDIDTREATVKMIKYPMAGMTTEDISVGVYNFSNQKTTFLNTKELKEYYLTNVTWSPDEKFIFIQVLNRAQNHLWLNKYDAISGKLIKTLFEEQNDKWVEPEEPIHFLNNNSKEFVFMSERDGYYHAYLCNTNGKIVKQLTKGEWVITRFMGFDKKNTKMYFMATKDSPIERHLYVLDMKSLKIKKITQESGTHNIKLSPSKAYAIDVYSNYTNISRQYQLLATSKAKNIKVIKKNKDIFKDFELGEMTISTLKAKDGTDLYYRLIKPTNFDANKKYPVLVYVYGGPHAQLINNTFLGGGGYFLQAMAAKGYVVFTVDNRGSGNRGFAFESGIHRQLGVLEMQDQMQGIDFLKNLNYVDTARIGVQGWSFGGFMTTALMLNHADVFKVGVAGGPVMDWKYYEIMYGDRYMDTPQENPEGYKNSSNINKAKNLKGKLLLIHGTVDPVVVWQHSQLFVKECVKNQKQLDYFIYPDHEHNVRGYDRLHLETKIAKYFDDYL